MKIEKPSFEPMNDFRLRRYSAITAAKELNYGWDCIHELKAAATPGEIERIMIKYRTMNSL